jgi:hypothetical protein
MSLKIRMENNVMNNSVITARTWEECQSKLIKLEQYVANLTKENGGNYFSRLFYRGQSNAKWRLRTTIEREININDALSLGDYYNIIYNICPQVETFTGRTWEISQYSKPDPDKLLLSEIKLPAHEYIVYLRHHRFPSPLLDWTRSPFIAAFFAFSDIDDRVEDVSIFVYLEWAGRGKSHRGGDPLITSLKSNFRAHVRHFLQQSEYTICTKEINGNIYLASHQDVFSMNGGEQDILWQINIPVSERSKVLAFLDSLNINAFSLFGSEESLMATLALREFHLSK